MDKAIFDISVKYSLSSVVICSGCRRSVIAVKSFMSEKNIVSVLRLVWMVTSFSATENALVDLRRED